MLVNAIANVLLWTSYFVPLYLAIFWLVVTFSSMSKSGVKRKDVLKHKPFVSVIIPSHNGAPTIRAAIDSVLKLDYPKERLEVIIVNDGSKDSTKLVVEDVMHHNPG